MWGLQVLHSPFFFYGTSQRLAEFDFADPYSQVRTVGVHFTFCNVTRPCLDEFNLPDCQCKSVCACERERHTHPQRKSVCERERETESERERHIGREWVCVRDRDRQTDSTSSNLELSSVCVTAKAAGEWGGTAAAAGAPEVPGQHDRWCPATGTGKGAPGWQRVWLGGPGNPQTARDWQLFIPRRTEKATR